MRYLLDTHVLIWVFEKHSSLKGEIHDLLVDTHNDFYVSVASIWEMSIKSALGKLETPNNVEAMIERHQFKVLRVELAHALEVRKLPLIHGDPFDRLLVAQAQCEQLILMTRDPHMTRYNVTTLMV